MSAPTAAIKNEVAFAPARRVNQSLTASTEKRALQWMALRAPAWLTSDQLTLLGLGAQIGAGVFYALSRFNRYALLLVILCLALNWFGDSMDGTLARVRNRQRPRRTALVEPVAPSAPGRRILDAEEEAILRHGPNCNTVALREGGASSRRKCRGTSAICVGGGLNGACSGS